MFLRLILTSVGILAVTNIYPGIRVDSITTAVVGAVVLGLVNIIVRRIVVFLTLPLSIFTLGLFLLIINAFMLYLSAWIVYGLHVDGFFAAFIGSLMISTIVTFLNGVVKSRS